MWYHTWGHVTLIKVFDTQFQIVETRGVINARREFEFSDRRTKFGLENETSDLGFLIHTIHWGLEHLIFPKIGSLLGSGNPWKH